MASVWLALALAGHPGDSALGLTALVAVAGLIAIALRNELRGRRVRVRVGRFRFDVDDESSEPDEPPQDRTPR
jgi:hypothetical protein